MSSVACPTSFDTLILSALCQPSAARRSRARFGNSAPKVWCGASGEDAMPLGKDTGMSRRRPLLVNADDLEQWSDRYEAAANNPLLVRRLVLAARGVPLSVPHTCSGCARF